MKPMVLILLLMFMGCAGRSVDPMATDKQAVIDSLTIELEAQKAQARMYKQMARCYYQWICEHPAEPMPDCYGGI